MFATDDMAFMVLQTFRSSGAKKWGVVYVL